MRKQENGGGNIAILPQAEIVQKNDTSTESGNNKNLESEFSPEVQEILDVKRKEFLIGEGLAYRFMSLDEYKNLMGQDDIYHDPKEVNVTPDIRALFASFKSHLERTDERFSSGKAWGYIGDHSVGGWSGFRGDDTLKKLAKEYKVKKAALSKEKGSIEIARGQLADELKDKVSKNIKEIRESRFNSDTADKIRALLEKPSDEFTLNDIKFLELYSSETHGYEPVDYHILTFWSADSHNEDPTNHRWSYIEENPKQLLAAMPIINNNALSDELTAVCLKSLDNDPLRAHLVLSIDGIEILPKSGINLPEAMVEMKNSPEGRRFIMKRRQKLAEKVTDTQRSRKSAYLHDFEYISRSLERGYSTITIPRFIDERIYLIEQLYDSVSHDEYNDYKEIKFLLEKAKVGNYDFKNRFIEYLNQKANKLGDKAPHSLLELIEWLKVQKYQDE